MTTTVMYPILSLPIQYAKLHFIGHHIITPWREARHLVLSSSCCSSPFKITSLKRFSNRQQKKAGSGASTREREEDNDNGTTQENAEDRTRVSASFEHAAGGGDVHVDVGLA